MFDDGVFIPFLLHLEFFVIRLLFIRLLSKFMFMDNILVSKLAVARISSSYITTLRSNKVELFSLKFLSIGYTLNI